MDNPPILVFSKQAVNKIDELIDTTEKREKGGVLCLSVNNEIYLENTVEGGEDEIDIQLSCKEEENPIGTFHTHPVGEIERISSNDYERATEDFITCIGQKIEGKNKIKCLIPLGINKKEKKRREYLIRELSEIDFLINIGYTKEEVEEKINKSGIREELDTYFNFLRVE